MLFIWVSLQSSKCVFLILRYYKKLSNVTCSKTYVFIIGSHQQNVMITREKSWQKRKSVPLVSQFYKKMNEKSLPQV